MKTKQWIALPVILLAMSFSKLSAQSMAPVVDQADSAMWLDALDAATTGAIQQTSGCSEMPISADAALMGMGSGMGCESKAGLWANSCSGGLGGCGLGSMMGGGCGIGSMGGGCGLGSIMGGGASGICPCGTCGGPARGRFDLWAGFLYLRPRNGEVNYAVPVDGPIAPVLGNGIQNGPAGVIDSEYEHGFRIGASVCGGSCAGLMTQWTHFQSHSTDVIKTTAPDVVRSLVTHPLGNNAAIDGLTATADLDIDFDLVDLAFRMPWKRCRNWCAEFLWGVRYGHLNQEFNSAIEFNGTTLVGTDIDFHGVGPRIGMLAQRKMGGRGVYAYSQGDASFLFGEIDAEYAQDNTFSGRIVDTRWESGRVVPQLDYELGLGVMSASGRFRVRAGYLVSAWFNTARTNEFINAVQTNDFDGIGDVISFDGLVFRSELRF